MTRRWSLARRLTLWFTVAVGGLAVLVTGMGWAILSRATKGELDLLLVEELHELDIVWPNTDRTPAAFQAVVDSFAEQHQAIPFAWRVRRAEDGALWGEFGRPELLARLPEEWAPRGRTRTVTESIHTRTELIGPDMLVEFAVDGTEPLRIAGRYGTIVLVLGAGATLTALLCGAFLGRRIGSLLRQVAAAVRSRATAEDRARLEVRGLPDEVREVVGALSDTLARIERDAERTRMLTAGLAHELRSPLQNLLGEAEVTLLRERPPAEYRRALESQLEELRDLVRVVDNLVLLCTPQHSASPELERFDLEAELELRLGKERAAAARRTVRIVTERLGDVELEGDREALVLAVRNLVSNAIDWAPEGSEVQVSLAGDPRAVTLTVDDAGPGVPEADREQIFTAFHSGRARAGRRAGYGLGLALTRAAVEAHGGRIEVGTAPLGGARFRVVLPRRLPAPGAEGSSSPNGNGRPVGAAAPAARTP